MDSKSPHDDDESRLTPSEISTVTSTRSKLVGQRQVQKFGVQPHGRNVIASVAAGARKLVDNRELETSSAKKASGRGRSRNEVLASPVTKATPLAGVSPAALSASSKQQRDDARVANHNLAYQSTRNGAREIPVSLAPNLRPDKTVIAQYKDRHVLKRTDAELSQLSASPLISDLPSPIIASEMEERVIEDKNKKSSGHDGREAHHGIPPTQPIHKILVQNFKTGFSSLFTSAAERSASPPRIVKPTPPKEAMHAYFDSVLARKVSSFNKRYFTPPTSNGVLNDYILIRTIGTGSFGRVVLARHTKTRKVYAIKILRKTQLITTRQVVHTLEEKRLLLAVNHEFITRLYDYFKDNSNLYMVFPFINGGDLFGLLNKVGKFAEWQAKFYIAQIILGMEYLHANQIVYRDLKPENILVTSTGYLKMTDFGFAKRLEKDRRTWTLCGTPEYLAPELIQGHGYALSVDWWTVGVLLYELCVGRSPFFDPKTISMYEKICAGNFRFPSGLSIPYMNLVSHILQVKVDQRLGCLHSGAKDLKNHEWMDGFDWIMLYEGVMVPPIQPTVNGPEDSRYFEKFEEAPVVIAAKPEFEFDFQDF